jgi:hypothetical protein
MDGTQYLKQKREEAAVMTESVGTDIGPMGLVSIHKCPEVLRIVIG